ncbi:MAG: alpha/beta fold hydrolase [Gammaproteobacteria bacterium]|nr:alpha/beta fold hydrolase [Gammaproteobacteria bacterium]
MVKYLLLAGGVYCFLAAYLYLMQRDMMYFPTRENTRIDAQNIWLEVNQQRLKVWHLNEASPAILFFGGNAEAVDYNIPEFKRLFADYSVYLVNYRGYGGSTGKPTEQGLRQDALAVYDAIRDQHSSISVFGRSLGTAMALYVAANRPTERIALVSPFDSLKNVAQSHYPLFPVKWLMKDQYDNMGLAGRISNPTLVISAEHDNVIPPKHTNNILKALVNARLETHVLENSGHNDLSIDPAFNQLLADFFQRD